MRTVRRILAAVVCAVLLPAGVAGAATTADPGAPTNARSPDTATSPDDGHDPADAGADPAADANPATRADPADPADAGAATPSDPLTPLPNPYLDYGFSPGLPREPPPPVVVGSGADALIRAPDLRGDNEPTLLERYGGQGLSLGQDTPADGGPDALSAVAAGLFGVATWLAQAVIAAFQWAFTVEVFAFLGDAVTTIVDALRELLYVPFVQAAVILAGGSLLWHGMVRRRGVAAAQGMIWTVVALTAAGVFFARPAAIIDGANHFSTGLSRAVLAGVSVADPGPGIDDGTTAATFDGHPGDTQLRVAGDRFWRVFVYEPWLVLQFGDPAVGAAYGERVLASRTVTADEREAVEGDPDALASLLEDKRDEAAAVREEILADENVAAWFTGRRPVERAGIAMLALLGVIVGGVLLVLVAAAILLAQIALLLLVLLGPVALLVGIHPGIGRVVAVRWAELAVGVLLRRVALGALLAVVLVLSGVLLEAAHPLGWFVVVSMQALVVAAAVVYRKPFSRLFAPTTVPALEVGGVRRVRRSLREQTARRLDRRTPAEQPARPAPGRARRRVGEEPARERHAAAGIPPARTPVRRAPTVGPARVDDPAPAVRPRRTGSLRAFAATEVADPAGRRDADGATGNGAVPGRVHRNGNSEASGGAGERHDRPPDGEVGGDSDGARP